MEVKTSGYGGREISEAVTVFTNDPRNPALELVLSGNVKAFAKIEPKNIRLFGKAGEPVAAVVEIVPGKDTPFKIKGVRAIADSSYALICPTKNEMGKRFTN